MQTIKTERIGTDTVSINKSDSKYYVSLTGNFKRTIKIVCSTEERAIKSFNDVVEMLKGSESFVPHSEPSPISDSVSVGVEMEDGTKYNADVIPSLTRGIVDIEKGTFTYSL